MRIGQVGLMVMDRHDQYPWELHRDHGRRPVLHRVPQPLQASGMSSRRKHLHAGANVDQNRRRKETSVS